MPLHFLSGIRIQHLALDLQLQAQLQSDPALLPWPAVSKVHHDNEHHIYLRWRAGPPAASMQRRHLCSSPVRPNTQKFSAKTAAGTGPAGLSTIRRINSPRARSHCFWRYYHDKWSGPHCGRQGLWRYEMRASIIKHGRPSLSYHSCFLPG